MSSVFDDVLAKKLGARSESEGRDAPAAMKVPEHIQKALRELLLRFETESDQSRREYVRKCLKNHEFFRGNQYLWFDPRIGAYRAPTQTGGLLAGATPSQAQNLYTINVFQGFSMAMIAILTANQPTVTFLPMRADNGDDRESADSATNYIRIFGRQSKSHQRLVDEVYSLWCDGTFGSYVHTVADGDRYGWIEEPVFTQQPQTIGQESYRCLACQAQSADLGDGTCAACGTPYSDGSIVPPQTVMQNVQTGTKKLPRARVTWDVIGGLELKLPPNAKEQAEYPYIIRSRELHKAYVRRAYPEIADRIVGGGTGTGGDSVERKARRQLAQGLTVENRAVQVNMGDEVTFKEAWFRPWAFYQNDDSAIREELLQMYPDGVYVAFSEDVFCEGRGEKMDDHWRVCHALPGRGQIREPIGGSLVQLQEITNDLYNIVRDSVEFTLPATFVDNDVLDVDRWARSNVLAGAMYNVRAKAGRSVSDSFWQTQPGMLPQYTGELMRELRTEIPQFTVGAFPAAYGGGTGSNNTAAIDVNTLVPTPGGFIRNGDLKANDRVFTERGAVCDVIVAHPAYMAESYRVIFSDGTEIIADDKHRWWTTSAKERERISNRSEKKRAQTRAYLRKRSGADPEMPRRRTGTALLDAPPGSFKNTREIRETLLDRRGRANHAVKVAEAFDVPPTDLPLDPWVLGVWLGDGAAADGRIACEDSDGEEMTALFTKAGWALKKLRPAFTWYAKGLLPVLRKVGVLKNKHVPDQYLWASKAQRLALLQGLMDTDGCATTEGKQFFANSNKCLVDAVYHLAASLGCKPRVVELKAGAVDNGKRESTKTYTRQPGWAVYWSSALPVFRLKRKLARINAKPVRDARKYRYIVGVEPAGERLVRCITVSNPTECFVCSESFICTGNSGIAMEKDAAMGRIGIFWRVLKEHHEDVAPLLVQEFVHNDMGPESITEQTEGGSFINVTVDPAQVKKGQYQSFAESTEDYPTTWPQRQGLVMTLMGNPLFQGAMTKLANADPMKRLLGLELEMPGEKAYQNAFVIIEKLVQQQPVPGPMEPVMQPPPPGAMEIDPTTGQPMPAQPQPVIDPMTGQPMMQPGPQMPSIMPGELDPFEVYLEACMDFDQSKAGQALREEQGNPGYLNFMLYALELKKRLMPPPGAGDPGAPEGQQPPPPEPA